MQSVVERPGADLVEVEPEYSLPLALLAGVDSAECESLIAGLATSGYQIRSVASLAEIGEATRVENPHVVFVHLDGYGGVGDFNALRDAVHPAPVVVLAPTLEAGLVERAIECGCDDIITGSTDALTLQTKLLTLQKVRELRLELQQQKTELAEHRDQQARDFDIAERIFANVLDRGVLAWPMFRHLHSPMAVFNGDLLLATPTPDGGIRVLVGDFTGHGLVASIGTMPVAEVFYGMTEKGFSVGELLAEINSKTRQVLPRGRFLAAAVLQLDPAHRQLTVWNGGLPEIVVYDGLRKQIRHRAPSRFLPLGVLETAHLELETERLDVEPGDRIFAYSDGVLEAGNPQGQQFGLERLLACVETADEPDQIFTAIESALYRHRAGRAQDDDITLLEMHCTGSPLPDSALSRRGAAIERASSAWAFTLCLQADCLRHADPLPLITHFVQEHQGIQAHRDRIYVVLSELYNNALDHGILELDSSLKDGTDGFSNYFEERDKRLAALEDGEITVKVCNTPWDGGGRLVVTVSDSGRGFDAAEVAERQPAMTYGRGMELVRGLCTSLRYNQNGNEAEATYFWS